MPCTKQGVVTHIKSFYRTIFDWDQNGIKESTYLVLDQRNASKRQPSSLYKDKTSIIKLFTRISSDQGLFLSVIKRSR